MVSILFLWLQDGIAMEVDVEKAWNEGSCVPIHKWLQGSQSEQDSSRLGCMGNIVVPMQALKASCVLSEMRAVVG